MRRTRVGAALLCVVLVAAAALAPRTGAVAHEGPVTLHTPAPAPGEVVAAGSGAVRVWVRSDASIASAELWLDDQPLVGVAVGPERGGFGRPVEAAADIEPGDHVVRAEVRDTAGSVAVRAWAFTATDRAAVRLAGDTRISTAVAISQAAFPQGDGAAAAVLARADDHADALAGTPLAAAVGGPLLLVRRDAVPSEVADELRRVLPDGAEVHLLGGEHALGPGVVEDVDALGFSLVRHAGPDRYATAVEVAGALTGWSRAVLVSGASFADALAASVPAARDRLPVLLTPTDDLAAATADLLAEVSPDQVTIVGGQAVVSRRVQEQVGAYARSVDRIAGADRYATAAQVLERFFPETAAVSLASGVDFPDALAGAHHAARAGSPLLLTDLDDLSAPTLGVLRQRRPAAFHVYGGASAVAPEVLHAAVRASTDGPDGPVVVGLEPERGSTVRELRSVEVALDRQVDVASSSVYVELDGMEVPGVLEAGEGPDRLRLRITDPPVVGLDAVHAARVVVAAGDGAAVTHDESPFALFVPDPVFATVGGVDLYQVSHEVELIGFHQSSHDGARDLDPRDTSTPKLTMDSRGRGTGLRTAADVVASPDHPVYSPVTGRVLRAGTYRLYCDQYDHYLVIEPDERPGWEVKLLHFTGLKVTAGDRVVAFETQVGDGPRTLPFESQVDDHSADRDWPHVHIEVVDPSIPDRPGGGC